MPLFYKPFLSTIATKDGKKKWHIRLVKSKKIVGSQKIGELIAEKSSLTPGDIHNTLRNLMSVMRDLLLNSRTVRLDGLGTFTMIAKSNGKGVDTPEEVNANQVTHLRVQFRPEYKRSVGSGVTRALFEGVEYERWGANSTSNKEEEEEDDDDDGGFVDPIG